MLAQPEVPASQSARGASQPVSQRCQPSSQLELPASQPARGAIYPASQLKVQAIQPAAGSQPVPPHLAAPSHPPEAGKKRPKSLWQPGCQGGLVSLCVSLASVCVPLSRVLPQLRHRCHFGRHKSSPVGPKMPCFKAVG